jgi:hypothetical protein
LISELEVAQDSFDEAGRIDDEAYDLERAAGVNRWSVIREILA